MAVAGIRRRLFLWSLQNEHDDPGNRGSLCRTRKAAGGAEAIRTANRVLRDAIADRAIDDPLAISVLESLAHDEDDWPIVYGPYDVASTATH